MNEFITLLIVLGYAILGFVAGHAYKTLILEINKMTELPRYKSHKTVQAMQIAKITFHSLGAVLSPVDNNYPSIKVDEDYVTKHNPQVGGYYVVYEDGYKSFSPAQAFEAGYTKI